jgi:hypothetical protein
LEILSTEVSSTKGAIFFAEAITTPFVAIYLNKIKYENTKTFYTKS